jgi:dihydroorotase-like cyclic amidohydrolase
VFIAAGRKSASARRRTGFEANSVLDATGCIVCPGLVDLAARLREPGFEYRATLESEMAAAPPAASPAWPARPTPTRCWTNPAWWKC